MKRAGAIAAALALTASAPGGAQASGVAGSFPWYVDAYGGEPGDLKALYGGRLGIVMARSAKPQLYIDWRLLHGQPVGQAAGEALSVPCCSLPGYVYYDDNRPTGARDWLNARKLVQGVEPKAYAPSGETQPYFMWSETCFDDAFRNAAATLKLRVSTHGASSPWVRAWLDGQDAVFATCRADTPLPALPTGAPGWLRADRDYQEAAYALYTGRSADAAARFTAIGADARSPWRGMGPYLKARTLRRAALLDRNPATLARARAAIAELAMRPAGTYGRDEVTPMLRSLAYVDRPRDLMAELTQELSSPAASPRLATSFRDVTTLAASGQPSPEFLDWILTMRAPVADDDEALAKARRAAFAHAQARWNATHDPAWLIAALNHVAPGAPEAASLMAAAAKVPAGDPAWLTAQYHLVRLGLATAPPAATRARLDAILARRDLSISDRNVFAAQRLQVAADARDFMRHALRRRLCVAAAYVDGFATPDTGCPRDAWFPGYDTDSGIYDGEGSKGTVGLGEDARAIIDRLPLAERIAVGRDPQLPGQLRLDLAITNYARAVLLSDHAAVDSLAGDLSKLLPQLGPEWRRIRGTPVGPAKRFAEYFVLAKVPGARIDLVDYTRPEGTVAEFQYYWVSWVTVPKGKPVMPAPPPLATYQRDWRGPGGPSDEATDLTCLGECSIAPAPLRLPDFAAALQPRALAERGYLVRREPRYDGPDYGAPPAMPPGATSIWDEMLDYARANPKDPQVPEALYWINRAGRWGGSHEHSGKRAFQLLHARYPASAWAKKSPYYYD